MGGNFSSVVTSSSKGRTWQLYWKKRILHSNTAVTILNLFMSTRQNYISHNYFHFGKYKIKLFTETQIQT